MSEKESPQTLNMDVVHEKMSQRITELVLEHKEKTGLSKNKIAAEIGIAQGTLSSFLNVREDGTPKDSSPVSMQSAYLICKYFHVSMEYLMGLTDVRTLNNDVRSFAAATKLSEPAVSTLLALDQRAPFLSCILAQAPLVIDLLDHIRTFSFNKMEQTIVDAKLDTRIYLQSNTRLGMHMPVLDTAISKEESRVWQALMDAAEHKASQSFGMFFHRIAALAADEAESFSLHAQIELLKNYKAKLQDLEYKARDTAMHARIKQHFMIPDEEDILSIIRADIAKCDSAINDLRGKNSRIYDYNLLQSLFEDDRFEHLHSPDRQFCSIELYL